MTLAPTARQSGLPAKTICCNKAIGVLKPDGHRKLGEIDRKIAEPNGVKKMPGHLGDIRHDDACPGCPIIDGLSGGTHDHEVQRLRQ